ncbi:MAG: DNA repair protein RadA [candidate division WOR-3 bacterium]|jgi:DNA repair protein RadA/Sms|nr:DNA repair protein RadA [candidate division WOR-3 bacterium]MCR4424533.1 DNA repair protein RadA [candidate division WOR-3 bacterium]MDH7519299.1 DNA repair protein RadA [bacterium]
MKKTHFICQNCGYESARWLGRCPNCGEWNSLVEEELPTKKATRSTPAPSLATRPVPLNDVALEKTARILTGIGELDRVLGGGVVPGSLLLLGGEPGIGKSTLLLQVCNTLARRGIRILYVTGEESPEQVRLRAARLGKVAPELFVLATVEVEEVLGAVEEVKPGLLVIDSIQTLATSTLASAPGSVAQVRECTAQLLRLAKSRRLTTFIIGHVTKFGAIAGPKTLEHMVDTVLYFEGETNLNYRIVRAVKNRYGSTNEIGVFEMTESGLKEVQNPSEFFLSGRRLDVSGSAVVATLEGTRPLLVEIQALAAPTPFALPQRVATGFDIRRLALLLCILERRAGIATTSKDIFLNIAGGIKLNEPAVDLGIVAALASALRNTPLPPDIVLFGEVGLAGEIRSVSRTESRITEAARLGFKRILLPERSPQLKNTNLKLVPVDTLTTALKVLGLKR